MARTSTKKSETKAVSETEVKVDEVVVETPVEEISAKKPVIVKEEKPVRKFAGDELIPCRSVTGGELICRATRDGETYHWSGYGDVKEMTFSDLSSLRAQKSAFIFDPLFIIEDDEVLEQPRWQEVKALYANMYDASDINEVLDMPLSKFKKVFDTLPKGLKEAVKTEIATQINRGTFDSIQKVRYVDEVCGTDLECLL